MSPITCAEVSELAGEYVLRTVDPCVAAEIREHLAAHPGAHPEYSELGRIIPAMAYLTDPVDPPAALKARVLAAAARTGQADAADSGSRVDVSLAPRIRDLEPRDRAANRPSGRLAAFTARRLAITGWATAAAAVAALVALVFVGVAPRPADDGGLTAKLQRTVSLAVTPGSRIAVIGAAAANGSTVANGPSGMAVIPRNGAGVLMMQGLPATSGAQVYEVWAIVGTGAPAPVGDFSVGSDQVGWLDSLTIPADAGVVIALTREPGPGATKPTLPIVASGQAGDPVALDRSPAPRTLEFAGTATYAAACRCGAEEARDER